MVSLFLEGPAPHEEPVRDPRRTADKRGIGKGRGIGSFMEQTQCSQILPAAEASAVPAEKEIDYTPHSVKRWIVLFLQGVIIGIGAILPGVSGGVLCVIFHLYRPMMELLANPIKSLRKYFWLFLPVILGWAVGFLALAGVVAKLFEKESNIVVCLFIGLIAGMFPSLFEEGAREGRTKGCWAALFISTAVLLAFFLFLQFGEGATVTPSIWWYLFTGVLWGVSLIVPGMSSSSLMIFLGLYGPLTAGAASLDFRVIGPVIIGIIVTVLVLARGVNALFKRYYGVAFHCIIGFVIASTIPIIPLSYKSVWEGLICLVLAVGGFFASFYLNKLGDSPIGEAAPEKEN